MTAPAAAIPLDELGALDVAVGECFAEAALDVLARAGVSAGEVRAIGSHGQTVRHRPHATHPFSLQIGDAAVIAERTGLCTVSDFRRADVAAGGQGAPLAPAFHAAILADRVPCAVLNLGGIANLSLLDRIGDVLGFDTGPANCLMDAWHERHMGAPCDRDGAWAASGICDEDLLGNLLSDPYFAAAMPKSTGREYFNLAWLEARIGPRTLRAVDVQATLLHLSARSIADAVRLTSPDTAQVFACGGGVHNGSLMQALAHEFGAISISSTAEVGIDPDYVEAALFAWLARERLAGRPGNRIGVTGARAPRMLGAIHAATR